MPGVPPGGVCVCRSSVTSKVACDGTAYYGAGSLRHSRVGCMSGDDLRRVGRLGAAGSLVAKVSSMIWGKVEGIRMPRLEMGPSNAQWVQAILLVRLWCFSLRAPARAAGCKDGCINDGFCFTWGPSDFTDAARFITSLRDPRIPPLSTATEMAFPCPFW